MTKDRTEAERLADGLARTLAGHFAANSIPTWETIHAAARELGEVRALYAEITRLQQERDAATREVEALRDEVGRLHLDYIALARAAAAFLNHPTLCSAAATLKGRLQHADCASPPPAQPSADEKGCVFDQLHSDPDIIRPEDTPEQICAQPDAGDVERAREIVDQFPVPEEFDAKECLIEEVAEALTAAREQGRKEPR